MHTYIHLHIYTHTDLPQFFRIYDWLLGTLPGPVKQPLRIWLISFSLIITTNHNQVLPCVYFLGYIAFSVTETRNVMSTYNNVVRVM